LAKTKAQLTDQEVHEVFAKAGFVIFDDEPSFNLMKGPAMEEFLLGEDDDRTYEVTIPVDLQNGDWLIPINKNYDPIVNSYLASAPISKLHEDLEKLKNSILKDRDIRVQGTFTIPIGQAPICPVCRTFDLTDFAGWIPYPLAGLDLSAWPTQDDEDLKMSNLYPFETTGTSVCGCSEFVTYTINVDLDPSTNKVDASFEVLSEDRLSRLTNNIGALAWLPNYR